MSRIIEEVEVDVPVRIAYDQWTQFESFPQFMEGVERVIQLDDKTLEWTASIAGKTKHWRAEIVEQRPDDIIAWRSIEGAQNDGAVRFETLSVERTRIVLQLDVEPDGLVEKAGDALGIVERRVRGDLERFKEFIESRGQATGAWRGEVDDGRVEGQGTATSASGRDPGAGTTGLGTAVGGASGVTTGTSGRSPGAGQGDDRVRGGADGPTGSAFDRAEGTSVASERTGGQSGDGA